MTSPSEKMFEARKHHSLLCTGLEKILSKIFDTFGPEPEKKRLLRLPVCLRYRPHPFLV